MDRLTFLSNVVASLAWPTTLLLAIFMLRRQVGNLVGTLRRLRWKDLEAEFGQEIRELEAAAKRLPPAEPESTISDHTSAPSRTASTSTVQALAHFSPPAALLTSWIGVEEAISQTLRRLSISADPPWHLSPLRKVELLQERTDIDQSTVAVLHRLRELRNRAAHANSEGPSLSATDAMEYHDAASRVVAALERIHCVPNAKGSKPVVASNDIPKRDGQPGPG